ncbi:MAG: FecR domain-containing protein [Bacteroidota bacterium]
MDSDNYLLHQLLHDPSFIRWVNQPTQEDTLYWESWLVDNPNHAETVEHARQLLIGVSFQKMEAPQDQIDQTWKQVARRTINPTTATISFWKQPWRYAAMLALVITASVGGWWLTNTQRDIEYLTDYGQTQNIILEDGTQVVLNGNSRLTVAPNWLERPVREVSLEGEAYFQVASVTHQNQKLPFRVQTPDLQIKVLGTQFNVNSRHGQTQVVLNEGKVAIDIPEKEEATLQPGDLVVYSTNSKEIIRRQVNPEIYSSWRKHQLILDETPVSHIIRQLEDTYGVEFILADESVRNRQISSTGSISAEDLESVLMALEALLQLRVEQTDNTIYLYEN